MQPLRTRIGIGLGSFFVALTSLASLAEVPRWSWQEGALQLKVEVLTDSLLHVEYSQGPYRTSERSPIWTSPMVSRTEYPGGRAVALEPRRVETPELRIEILSGLCARVTELKTHSVLTTLCPDQFENDWKALTLTSERTQNIYGLGQKFRSLGESNGDWLGSRRSPGGAQGNAMVAFGGGGVGDTQFPILYALGPAQGPHYALFFDHLYKQDWDFTRDLWRMETWGDQVRFYVIGGESPKALRRSVMDLLGRAPVPPRKMFGLWVSEYSYDSWDELDQVKTTLQKNGFPLDGFVMDLAWFGGVVAGSDFSPMGTLRWDERAFPNPHSKIARLRSEDGLGLMLIEESYISRGLSEHRLMESKGYLARDCATCGATYITENPWWGTGGLIDWSNPEARDFWHDWKRQPLVDMGVLGHWTDLGEPEMFNAWAVYRGFPEIGDKNRQADVHNVYNLLWNKSIFDGYIRNGVNQRPFIMSRSGTAGIQRFGAAMWSADIGSNLRSLATHYNARMHMAWSGVDYYGSDIGGFHRAALEGDLDEMYTQWFANSSLFDVPVRPHTENLSNTKHTAPDRIGSMQSNLENIRLRYRLIPTYYSLAHGASETGDALMPPLALVFPNDPAARGIGHQAMIGEYLMGGIVARHGETERRMYLPEGEWFDFRTGERFESRGEWSRNLKVWDGEVLSPPLLARAGGIFALAPLHPQNQKNNSAADATDLRIYPSREGSEFTLVEDDGETIAYQKGALRRTRITQRMGFGFVRVEVGAAQGSFPGAVEHRAWRFEVRLPEGTQSVQATWGGRSIPVELGRDGFARVSTPLGDVRGTQVLLVQTGRIK
jgi:alpha-glucosidase (family GH31 glycosyl hydrolase)